MQAYCARAHNLTGKCGVRLLSELYACMITRKNPNHQKVPQSLPYFKYVSCPGTMRVSLPGLLELDIFAGSCLRSHGEDLEAKLGIHDIRLSHWQAGHYAHSRVLRYLGHVFRMDACRPDSISPAALFGGGWQAAVR